MRVHYSWRTRGATSRREQAHVVHLVDRALRVDVEGADTVDFVVEQIDAIGNGAAHRKQIDHAAAEAVLARRDHLRDVAVARHGELTAQRFGLDARALLQEEAVGGEELDRRQALERGGHRHDQHIADVMRDVVERGEPLGNEILVRRKIIVGQRFPVREQIDAQPGLEEGQFLREALAVERLAGEDGKRPAAAGEGSDRERVAGALQATDQKPGAGSRKREGEHAAEL